MILTITITLTSDSAELSPSCLYILRPSNFSDFNHGCNSTHYPQGESDEANVSGFTFNEVVQPPLHVLIYARDYASSYGLGCRQKHDSGRTGQDHSQDRTTTRAERKGRAVGHKWKLLSMALSSGLPSIRIEPWK